MTHDERRLAAINEALGLIPSCFTAEMHGTGGNCTAAVIPRVRLTGQPDKVFKVMITAEDGMYMPEEGDDTIVGIYDIDDAEDEGRVIYIEGPQNWKVRISKAVEDLMSTKP